MSLTSHLKNKQSPVRRYLRNRFPNTRGLMKFARDDIRDADTVRPTGTDRIPGTVGTAFDYRARYYFDITPLPLLIGWHGAQRAIPFIERGMDFEGVDGVQPDPSLAFSASADLIADFFLRLDRFFAMNDPVGKCLEPDIDEELNRYCFVLALFEEVVRAGPQPTSILFREEYESVDDLLQAVPDIWVGDLSELSALFYCKFESRLDGSAILNPTFDGSSDVGGADGDLILDRCLIDFKATVNPRLDSEWLRQLVGYVLLDYSDEYRLDAVAIYLARQGVLLQWPLEEFLQTMTDDDNSLATLRDEFGEVAKSLRQ